MFCNGNIDQSYLDGRAILVPALDVVDQINEYMSDMNDVEGRRYLSCDTVCKSNSGVDTLSNIHSLEFLNGLRCSGIMNHSLTLKVGSPVMLLRSIDHSFGLCNSTRLIISHLTDHVWEVKNTVDWLVAMLEPKC